MESKAAENAWLRAEADAKVKEAAQSRAMADTQAQKAALARAEAEEIAASEAASRERAEIHAMNNLKMRTEADAKAKQAALARAEADSEAESVALSRAEAEMAATAESEARIVAETRALEEAKIRMSAETLAKVAALARLQAESSATSASQDRIQAESEARLKAESRIQAAIAAREELSSITGMDDSEDDDGESYTYSPSRANIIPMTRPVTGNQKDASLTDSTDTFEPHTGKTEKRARWLAGIAAGLIAGVFYVFPFSSELPQVGYVQAKSVMPDMAEISKSDLPDENTVTDPAMLSENEEIVDSGMEVLNAGPESVAASSDILWNGWKLSSEMTNYHGESAMVKPESRIITAARKSS